MASTLVPACTTQGRAVPTFVLTPPLQKAPGTQRAAAARMLVSHWSWEETSCSALHSLFSKGKVELTQQTCYSQLCSTSTSLCLPPQNQSVGNEEHGGCPYLIQTGNTWSTTASGGKWHLEEGTARRLKTGKSNQSRTVPPASPEMLLSTRSCLRLDFRQNMSILPVRSQHSHTQLRHNPMLAKFTSTVIYIRSPV